MKNYILMMITIVAVIAIAMCCVLVNGEHQLAPVLVGLGAFAWIATFLHANGKEII